MVKWSNGTVKWSNSRTSGDLWGHVKWWGHLTDGLLWYRAGPPQEVCWGQTCSIWGKRMNQDFSMTFWLCERHFLFMFGCYLGSQLSGLQWVKQTEIGNRKCLSPRGRTGWTGLWAPGPIFMIRTQVCQIQNFYGLRAFWVIWAVWPFWVGLGL